MVNIRPTTIMTIPSGDDGSTPPFGSATKVMSVMCRAFEKEVY